MTKAVARTRKAVSKVPQELADLEDAFLLCRDMRHPWMPYDADIDKKNGVITRILQCSRCKTKRFEKMTFKGVMLTKPRYEYADGYQIRGLGYITADIRAQIRVMNILGRK